MGKKVSPAVLGILGIFGSSGCGITLVIVFILIGISAAVGINWFDDNSTASGLVGPVTETTWQMPSAVQNKIISKKSFYQDAASKTNVPWQLLASINYRECGLSDCGPSGEEMGTVNPDSHIIECPIADGYVSCLEKVAAHLKSLAKGVYGVTLTSTSDEKSIRLAMLAYNRGYMYKTGGCDEIDSPYVWNQFDSAHKNMRWPNNSCEPSSTQGQINIPAGGFTIYSYLINNNI